VLFADKNTLAEAWNSPTKKMLATALDYGKIVDSCSPCQQAESIKKSSSRQQFNKVFGHLDPLPDQPRVLIMKPGNVCNLACRMCNPATSTGWYKDAYQLAIAHDGFSGTAKDFTKQYEKIRSAFDKDNNIWQTVERWLPNLEFFDIYGGEPFLTPGLFQALGKVKNASTISLQLHTNATIWNPDYLNILTRYKHVKIGISIDSHMNNHLEYIRYPVNATQVFDNLRRYKSWAINYSNIELYVSITTTPLNVFYIDQIKKNLALYGLEIGSGNFVYSPPEYDIRHIPISLKKIIAEKIYQDANTVKFMMQNIPGCDIAWPKFWKITKELDRIRGQSFESTFPEFYEKMKPYVNIFP
jgi:sulfatase maturation enzyme AslB (radical SAM superfamily)